jgi:fatty acid desaturase
MLSKLRTWATQHPKLVAWIALAIGMVIVLILAARDVGLVWNQWLFLILATIGLAGLCVWIISWEAHDEEEDAEAPADTPLTAKPANAKRAKE